LTLFANVTEVCFSQTQCRVNRGVQHFEDIDSQTQWTRFGVILYVCSGLHLYSQPLVTAYIFVFWRRPLLNTCCTALVVRTFASDLQRSDAVLRMACRK